MTADLKTRSATLARDRRRPGPRVPVTPELIPLLRGQHGQGTEPDSLGSARGVGFAVLACAVFWAAVASLF